MKPQVQVTEIKPDPRYAYHYGTCECNWVVDLTAGKDVTRLAWFRYELDARQFAKQVADELGDDI